jgi:uncharacterized membrane protein required for colicin V production
MMTLTFTFWMMVVIFAVIGAMRGWAKELLVTFSVILALFIIAVLSRYVPPIRDFFAPPNGTQEFWIQTFIVLVLAFFGYQTPNISRFTGTKFARERFSDALLGLFLGALNGYLIVGSIWYFMAQSNYPYPQFISKPVPTPPIMTYLPPEWLGIPTIYFAVALSFLFVLVVFI